MADGPSSITESEAKDAFKARVEGTIGYNLRFLAYACDYIVAMFYSVCCKCCWCCASDRRGPAFCRRKASFL